MLKLQVKHGKKLQIGNVEHESNTKKRNTLDQHKIDTIKPFLPSSEFMKWSDIKPFHSGTKSYLP